MILSIVVAVARDGAIGRGNQLPWRLSGDLRRFKALTTGHTIIMGRHTYESLPHGALPERRNIVLSRQLTTLADAEVYPSLESVLQLPELQGEELFVIGGGKLYAEALPLADRIYLTEVDAEVADADTHFPQLPPEEWERTLLGDYPADERNEYPCQLYLLTRRGTNKNTETNLLS